MSNARVFAIGFTAVVTLLSLLEWISPPLVRGLPLLAAKALLGINVGIGSVAFFGDRTTA